MFNNFIICIFDILFSGLQFMYHWINMLMEVANTIVERTFATSEWIIL